MTVSEQFAQRERLVRALYRWNTSVPPIGINTMSDDRSVDLQRFEEECGVRCYYSNNRISGWNVVDQKKFFYFLLSWL